MKYYQYIFNSLKIRIHRCGACAPVIQQTRVWSPVGTSLFPGRGFFGVFPHRKTNVRELLAHKLPGYHLAVIIIVSYSPFRMNGCMNGVYRLSSSCYLGSIMLADIFVEIRKFGLFRMPRHWADPSSGKAFHVLVWSKRNACDSKLIPSPYRSWLY